MGGESIKPIRKRIHVYFLMTAYEHQKLTRFGQYAKASFTSFIFIYWADITGV